jgi:putative phage-type endonuclease
VSLSPEQFEIRRTGMTATDISAVLGVNPWRSPLDVWRDKVEPSSEPSPDTDRSLWGQRLEPLIRSDYEARHDMRVEVPGTLRKPGDEWMIATPDGICYRRDSNEAERGLEIKVHGRDAIRYGGLHYGDPGTDDVPLHELCQCAWGMGVTGLPRWDLVPFIDGTPIEFIIDRDDDLIASMIEGAQRFMRNYVDTKTPPPPDGSEAWDSYLKSKWKENHDMMRDVSNDMDAVADINALREAKDRHAILERQIDTIVQRLKVLIADGSGLAFIGDSGKKTQITWRRNRSSAVTDYLGVLGEFRSTAALVASGKADELEAIDAALRRFGGGYVGSTTFSGIALAETFTLVRQTLVDIAKMSCEPKHQVVKLGNRPFNVPKSWKQSRKKGDE